MSATPSFIFYPKTQTIKLWPDLEISDMREREDAVQPQEVQWLKLTTITIPFYYWEPKNRNNLPEYANVFKYGNYPLDRPNTGRPPDIIGRLKIEIKDELGSNHEKIRAALNRVTGLFREKRGQHSLLFKTFVPFSTRDFKDCLRSLFPFTGLGRDLLTKRGNEDDIARTLVVGVIMLIVDLSTLIFRLIALIPRAIYQHYLQKPQPLLAGVEIFTTNYETVDLAKGTIVIYSYNPEISSDGPLRINLTTPPSFYLG